MLKFYGKVATQHLLSTIPAGQILYDKIQDKFANSIQPTATMVQKRADMGLSYLQVLEDLNEGDILQKGTHLDIGAGWHFTIPILFYGLGCDNQVLIDVKRLARSDTVLPVIDLLPNCDLGKYPLRRSLPDTKGHDLDSYLDKLGIQYKAPVNGQIPVPDASVSVVTMTGVLLHPPRSVVRQIFEDVARVLKPGGYFIARTSLIDQYSVFDRSISRFNFLRYRKEIWERWYNNKIIGFNRLRVSDFENMFEGLPYEKSTWDVVGPTEDDYKELDRVPLSHDFNEYSRKDLASTILLFAMKKV
jgi:SAM-dependent methyltransferase